MTDLPSGANTVTATFGDATDTATPADGEDLTSGDSSDADTESGYSYDVDTECGYSSYADRLG